MNIGMTIQITDKHKTLLEEQLDTVRSNIEGGSGHDVFPVLFWSRASDNESPFLSLMRYLPSPTPTKQQVSYFSEIEQRWHCLSC